LTPRSILLILAVPALDSPPADPTPEITTWANIWLFARQKKFKWQHTADILCTYGMKILGWLILELLGLMPLNLIYQHPTCPGDAGPIHAGALAAGNQSGGPDRKDIKKERLTPSIVAILARKY
jgi:hypothetical protein